MEMHVSYHCRRFSGAVALVLGWALIAQAQHTPSGDFFNPHKVPVDPIGQINQVDIEKERFGELKQTNIPRENFRNIEFKREKKDDEVTPKTPSKISPVLMQWLQSRNAQERVDVIITFQEDRRIPLMPLLGQNEKREQEDTARSRVIDGLIKERRAAQEKTLQLIDREAQFKARDFFWIANAVAGTIPLGAIESLAKAEQVVYVQPVEGGEKPPQDGNNDNDVVDGRAHISSDPYFNIGLTQPWIGLLDTGVTSTHNLFNSPDHIAFLADCVNGGTNCLTSSNPGFDPSDFFWNHGTSSAAILSGNNRLGNRFRGATEVRTDSWQVYTAGGLNTSAAVRGIEAGVRFFDKVLVGEIQANESETGAIATAADNAYDAGAIIVSANGNFGPGEDTVRSPAIAHKVIGVGAFFVDSGNQYNNQGRGSATDGRYKPDIQAPTLSETASNASNTALKIFSGTSGATPYASSAAMLGRNWLNNFGTVDNGQTYALMILWGQDPYPYDHTVGAGRLKMGTNGTAFWGKLVVGNGLTIDIPINIPTGRNVFDSALWWPESATQSHNDIDLHLLDPNGVERDRGFSSVSVFERAQVNGGLQAGTWTLRVRGWSVPTGAQVVYWAARTAP